MGFTSWLRGGATAEFNLEQIFWDIAEGRTDVDAFGVASVFRARQMNADTLASLPLRVGDSLLPAPNRDQDTQGFVTETILSLQDHGDAYWRLDATGEIRVLPAEHMVVEFSHTERVEDRRRVYRFDNRVMRTAGVSRNLLVLSINRGPNDLTGFGPMQSKKVKSAVALVRYIDDYYISNAQPSGILSSPSKGTADEAKLLKESWLENVRARQPAVIFGDMEWKSTAFSPNDSQWVQAAQLSIGEISTLFGVPGSLLNFNMPGSSLTYENVESVYQGYWRQTLKPTYGSRIERALTDVLGSQVRFDPEELFLASIQDRATAASQLAGAGFDGADAADAVGLPVMGFERKDSNVPTSG